ncbi:MAG TPA: carbonic anhydrase, partial [Burkholderiaceae bacterium]|nr:carbonic anhydrase [Burkholderiaceae bacterium]
MDLPTRLILQNSAWAADTSARDPALFRQLAEGQQPRVLWIGCCDSRVPAERVTNAVPGELFVHRSIANLVSADDASVMSALQYALQVLKVEHVIVCGHEACGGVRASLLPPTGDESAADNYLARHI